MFVPNFNCFLKFLAHVLISFQEQILCSVPNIQNPNFGASERAWTATHSLEDGPSALSGATTVPIWENLKNIRFSYCPFKINTMKYPYFFSTCFLPDFNSPLKSLHHQF